MLDDYENLNGVTAADARRHLVELENERALAIDVGVNEVQTYKSDLDREIEAWRQLYVVFAVTDIAILRGELGERNFG
jgi:hypothetical protein